MPTTKTRETVEVNHLRRRVSELTDRIAILEHTLKKTQDLIQADIKSLYNSMERK